MELAAEVRNSGVSGVCSTAFANIVSLKASSRPEPLETLINYGVRSSTRLYLLRFG